MNEIRHAYLIRAVLDGKIIQWRPCGSSDWRTPETGEDAIALMLSFSKHSFRIKPEDKVMYGILNEKGLCNFLPSVTTSDNIKATFDGETGKLKSVELI